MQTDWEIKSRGNFCSKTEREFNEGELFYTLLFREGEGFRREDLSEEAWAERNENIQPYSHWKSKYTPPPPVAPEALPKESAESLLRKLMDDPNPGYANIRYILTLMLERKRILKPMPATDDDNLIYEHAATGETFIVSNPHLSMDQIPAVQLEVSQLLSQPLTE
ncbi:MAG: hypothetical protein ABI443_12390 [Chthoniobacterales bacterium]